MKRRSDNSKAPTCQCGCGKPTKKSRNGTFNSYCHGHNSKSQSPDYAGNRWRPGQSGNPAGNPKGSKHKITKAAVNILESESGAIARHAVDAAMSGDRMMIKLILDKCVAPKKSTPVKLPDMPKVNSVADASKLTGFVLSSISEGMLSPVDGEIISRSCQRHLQALQVSDLEQRLVELENQLNGQGDSA